MREATIPSYVPYATKIRLPQTAEEVHIRTVWEGCAGTLKLYKRLTET